MNERLRELARQLRQLSSSDAADWLLQNCPLESPAEGDAWTLLTRRSWKPADQYRLAQYYLSSMPHASSMPYEVFASIMPVLRLVAVLEAFLPVPDDRRRLVKYHLSPVLIGTAQTEQAQKIIEDFLQKI